MHQCNQCGRVYQKKELKMFSHIHDKLPCGHRYGDTMPQAQQNMHSDAATEPKSDDPAPAAAPVM